MQTLSLHHVKSRTKVSRYALVLCLLLSIGLSIFSEWHNPSHVLQTDQHCALCLNAHNLDNAFPVDTTNELEHTRSYQAFVVFVVTQLTRFVASTGNRDPPDTL